MCAVPLSALSSTCDVAAQDLQWAVCSMGSRGVLLASRPPDPARPAPPRPSARPGPARPHELFILGTVESWSRARAQSGDMLHTSTSLTS